MKNLNFFIAAVVAMVAMTGCSESLIEQSSLTPEPPAPEAVPEFYIPVAETYVELFTADSTSLGYADSPFGLEAQDTIKVSGTEGLRPAERLEKAAERELRFAYTGAADTTNMVKVAGLTMTINYDGQEYTLHCGVELQVSGEHAVVETSDDPSFYELSETVYTLSYGEIVLAEAVQAFVVEEGYIPPVFDHVDWTYRHEAFQREAVLSNNTVNVFCDNVADFVQVMSDNSRRNAEEVDYTVVNRFAISVPEIKATADDEVVGKTYDFNNGVVTVAGIRLEAQRTSAEVEGKVVYMDKDYAGEIEPCVAEAKTITFTSASEAVIRFYDEDSKDYAEAIIPATVVPYEEPVTVVDVDRDYRHDSFRSNAVVANNTISVVCDNEAVQTTTMSDGTSSKETTDYTVTNRFVYSLASMPASVKGQSFRFNAGTAVVEGRDVNVNFSAREVSAIMFNGTDYRSEAPVCAVEVSTITFQENGAVIVFTHGNETVSASIPVNYIEAEVIDGKIVGMWITDSYDLYCHYVSTDLHILVENNGAYVAYSRNVNGTDWTVTDLSAADGQDILSSGRAMAWAQPGRIGTVSAVKSSKDNTGYIITYYFPNGAAANIMGDAEAALNGNPFTDPVKATGSADNGLWTISYNGVVNYFVGTIM